MGHGFGELAKIRGIIYFKLSPHEINPFKGLFSHSLFNIFKRMRSQMLVISVPLIMGYSLYDWAENEFHHLSRKNPKDYENDV